MSTLFQGKAKNFDRSEAEMTTNVFLTMILLISYQVNDIDDFGMTGIKRPTYH